MLYGNTKNKIPSQPTACKGEILFVTTYFSSYTIWAAVITWAININESPEKTLYL